MTTKNDLRAVRDQLIAADRERLGDPPTADEIVAYSRGELSGAEEERVRELLVCYPELARVIAVPFGEDGDEALPQATVDRQWQDFQRRRVGPKRPPQRVWQAAAALAASLTVLFATLFWNAQKLLHQPRLIVAEHILEENPSRGTRAGAGTVISANAEGDVVLIASLYDRPEFPNYRVDLVDVGLQPPRRCWSSTHAGRLADDGLRILISAGSLAPGKYELVIWGVDGQTSHQLVRYPVRVEAGGNRPPR